MDNIARFNKERWDELAKANVEFARPFLDLTPTSARQVVDPYSVMGEVQGKNVLCLASGGGQQSVAFAILGAKVTVVDISTTQLEQDRAALAHHQLTATLLEGDMRDLSHFAGDGFDVVWHAYSISFIPDAAPVFDEVQRVLKSNGLYRLEWHNPFSKGTDETNWNGEGYTIKREYRNGEITFDNPHWEFTDANGVQQKVEGPREFNHTLSTVVNGLIQRGFALMGLWEEASGDFSGAGGSWEHFKAVAPPCLTVWAKKF